MDLGSKPLNLVPHLTALWEIVCCRQDFVDDDDDEDFSGDDQYWEQ